MSRAELRERADMQSESSSDSSDEEHEVFAGGPPDRDMNLVQLVRHRLASRVPYQDIGEYLAPLVSNAVQQKRQGRSESVVGY